MSIEEQTIFERLGVEYEEVDGIFYPKLDSVPTEKEQLSEIGKYGLLWVDHMKQNYPICYHTIHCCDSVSCRIRLVW